MFVPPNLLCLGEIQSSGNPPTHTHQHTHTQETLDSAFLSYLVCVAREKSSLIQMKIIVSTEEFSLSAPTFFAVFVTPTFSYCLPYGSVWSHASVIN